MISTCIPNGFYQVANVPYISKIEALLAADKINGQVTYNFHDDQYGKHDWSTEPAESLDQLYLNRIVELRNKYDYLVLNYSGGSDSNNILEVCVRHGIEIDEVFMRGPLGHIDKDIQNTSAANMFAEVFINAVPIATHVKNTCMPNLKIRVVDNTEHVIKTTSDSTLIENMFDPMSLGIGSIGPNLLAGKDFDSIVPEYRKIAESGKKIGHIMGVDKPRLTIENGEFFIDFLDKSIQHMITNRVAKVDLPVYKELFYWGETTAPIIIKQAHLIKRYIKAHALEKQYMLAPRDRSFHDFLSGILYPPRMFPIEFNSEKMFGVSPIMPWEKFFFQDPNATHYLNWKKQVALLDQAIPEKYKHTDAPYFNLKGIFSPRYSIGV